MQQDWPCQSLTGPVKEKMTTNSKDQVELQVKMGQFESRLNHLEEKFDSFLSEIRLELREIKSNTEVFQRLSIDHAYNKDSISRAFSRIEKLEVKQEEYNAMINQWKGARTLAWTVWTILGSGVGLLILKVFFGVL